jgi:DNA-binding NarL/FixJ family response regulator
MSLNPAERNSDRKTIRILVADDHPLLRDGITALVSSQTDMEIVAEASNGREAVEQFLRHTPDITLMDLQMPEAKGIDAIMTILQSAPQARIIVLTTYSGDVQAVRALQAGARAYLLKDSLHKDLLAAIRSVHVGHKTMSPSVAAGMAEHSAEDALTDREIDVLRLIAGGHANKEIAAQLATSEDAIKSRMKNILAKLHANDRTHAVMIALRRGIIDSQIT